MTVRQDTDGFQTLETSVTFHSMWAPGGGFQQSVLLSGEEFVSSCTEMKGYIHDALHAWIVLLTDELIYNRNSCEHVSVCHLSTFIQVE